jgi:hypothetical protein
MNGLSLHSSREGRERGKQVDRQSTKYDSELTREPMNQPTPDATFVPSAIVDLFKWLWAPFVLAVGWIVTLIKTRQQLLDHITECDRRYGELNARTKEIREDVKALLENWRRF